MLMNCLNIFFLSGSLTTPVGKLSALLELKREGERLTGPLALVRSDERRHVALKLRTDAKLVVNEDPTHLLDPALIRLEPSRRSLEPIGGVDVEPEEDEAGQSWSSEKASRRGRAHMR